MKYNKISLSLALALSASSVVAVADDAVDENIETIVITGQKIDRSLKETANSVAVVTANDIDKLNIQNVSDIYNVMPNVSGDFNQGFSIRGINAFNVSGGGNSFLTSMYLDGAPLPYRVVRNGTVSVWDIAQVEVFRGPQSTLQGRNALAGAIMLRTQDPTYEWSGKAKATIGNYGQQELAMAGGGALIDDLLAFRISAQDKKYDGDIYNTTRRSDSNYEDSENFRAKLLFEPIDTFSALLTVSKDKSEIGPQWALFDFGGTAFDREVDFNSPIWEKTDTTIYNLEMSWEVNDNVTFDSITTYSDSDYGYNWDGDLQSTQITADNTYQRNDKTFSQEFRLTYESDEIQAVGGFYASKLDVEDSASGERFITFFDLGLPSLSALLTAPAEFGGFGLPAQYAALVVPLYPNIDPIKLGLSSGLEQEVKTWAIYGDMTYQLNDQFDLLLGLRYDKEEQTNSAESLYAILNTMPDPAMVPAPIDQVVTGINGMLNGMAATASGVEPPSTADFDAWLPKVGVSYHLNDDVTTSFIYQRGYRSGGVGTNIAQSRIYTYDPEYTDNYELSLRSVWLGGKLMFNTNVFYTQWTDQQISIQLSSATFDTETVNAGESNIKGFESELFFYPSEALTIIAGVGLAKTEFTKFEYVIQSNSEVKDLSGRPFTDSPEWTANIAVNYDFGSGFSAGINANYKSNSTAYLDPEISLDTAEYQINPDPKNDHRIVVNGQASYEWDSYLVRLDISNIFDEQYIASFFSDADSLGRDDSYGQHQIGRSRQISLTLQAEF